MDLIALTLVWEHSASEPRPCRCGVRSTPTAISLGIRMQLVASQVETFIVTGYGNTLNTSIR